MPDWVSFGRMFWNNTSAPAGELQRIRKGADKILRLSIVFATYRYQRSYTRLLDRYSLAGHHGP